MCGIAGIISSNGNKIENGRSRVSKMLSIMEHRGPDSSGIYQNNDETVILGNNRLAITDPLYEISGPMITSDNNHAICYNGEIYDFKDHFNRFINKGIPFESKTDTEVLLKGLINEGINFLNTIDGCWAFAYYNDQSKKIIISRDLLGEKQIFYYKSDKEFIFASEASAVASAITNKIHFNMQEIITSMRFFSSSINNTIISEIKKFKPGQTVTININKKFNLQEGYPCKLNPLEWDDFFKSNPSDDKVMETLSELLFNSVRNRLSPDVPFFTTLSGGIDSNLITYFASLEKKNLDTVFIQTSEKMSPSLEGEELNEKEASRYTANILKTNHLELNVDNEKADTLLKKNAENSIDGVLDWGISSFELIGDAIKKQGYKVLLVSEAADELCGYKSDMENYQKHNFMKNNNYLALILNALNSNYLIRKVFRRVNFIKNNINEPYCSDNPFIFKPFHEAIGVDFLSKLFQRNKINLTNNAYGTISHEYQNLNTKIDYSQRMALSYMNFSVPSFNNLRLDRALMGASVEPRIPFLNIKLVNFFLAMPSKYKFRNGNTKYILRKMVEKYIGKKIAWRKKHGFSYPIWKIPKIRKKLNVEDAIFNSIIINSLPWDRSRRSFLRNNIDRKFSKFSWPLFALSAIEKKYNIKS